MLKTKFSHIKKSLSTYPPPPHHTHTQTTEELSLMIPTFLSMTSLNSRAPHSQRPERAQISPLPNTFQGQAHNRAIERISGFPREVLSHWSGVGLIVQTLFYLVFCPLLHAMVLSLNGIYRHRPCQRIEAVPIVQLLHRFFTFLSTCVVCLPPKPKSFSQELELETMKQKRLFSLNRAFHNSRQMF